MVTRVSRNGSVPCFVGSSTVDWMCGSWLLICCSNGWLCFALVMTKVSSTNLSHKGRWVWAGIKGFYLKLFHEQVCYDGANGGAHGSTLHLFLILTLEEEVSIGEAELQ